MSLTRSKKRLKHTSLDIRRRCSGQEILRGFLRARVGYRRLPRIHFRLCLYAECAVPAECGIVLPTNDDPDFDADALGVRMVWARKKLQMTQRLSNRRCGKHQPRGIIRRA